MTVWRRFRGVWRRQRQEASTVSRNAFVPLVFAPGEAFQFDWSEDWVVIGAERTKLMVAQFKLCHSRAFMRLCCKNRPESVNCLRWLERGVAA